MVTRWSTTLFVGGGVLAVGGLLLYGWSTAAGVGVHVLVCVLVFLGYRLRKQGAELVEMAGSL